LRPGYRAGAAGYAPSVIRPWLGLLVMVLVGCVDSTPTPSTPAQRTPTPGSVTRENPGGDAQSPTDAALMRLLEQPIGFKEDKFGTIHPHLADADNWRRMRFFGYPTRAAFRYGKDRYATVVISYSKARDDSPASCVEAFVQDAKRMAESFDVEVGPFEREMRSHKRGIEAIDMAELARRQDRWEKDRAEQRAQLRARLRRLRAIARVRAMQVKAAPAKPSNAKEAPAEKSAEKPAEEPGEKPAETPAETPAQPKPVPKRNFRFMFKLPPVKPLPHPLDQMLAEAGTGDMPVVRTSGQMETLSDRDRYLVAIVAYESWPGTCLVQSLALKIGTDEALASRVRERWITEIAPALEWKRELREQPPIQNR